MPDLARAYHLGNSAVHPTPETERYAAGEGISLREHYAGLAMEGLLARNYPSIQETAKEAVKMADLLLLELTENRTP